MGKRLELLVHLGVCTKAIHCRRIFSYFVPKFFQGYFANQGGDLKGIKVSKMGPKITHLLFADDLLFFGRATKKVAKSMAACLEKNLPMIRAESEPFKVLRLF
ncbi:LOW QUALITY PROTEIN: hypothetical protein TorRG33x02_069850 [Trema orientale]|uniref:Reverse transcriptase domain-containing protein n=1 Tax=Trema orientale TaxID=63057 RepID=A0A2P5FHF8_TREOI|nr:LOW QUALITY PROTEIN: hypothetical protein TorRG33x02_069850 [Trema orientale]